MLSDWREKQRHEENKVPPRRDPARSRPPASRKWEEEHVMKKEVRPARFEESRFLLWVDAVGGYYVTLSSEVLLGQVAPGNPIHIPIMGDLSRQHAMIRRRGEGYLIEPFANVKVNGVEITGPRPLAREDEIRLGDVVRLRFRQPHALSATARLDFLSSHRTQPHTDGVLLLAESCVLGPRKSNHVLCKNWARDVILYRKDDKLYCRSMGELVIDGKSYEGRGELTLRSHIVGEDFSLSLEPVH